MYDVVPQADISFHFHISSGKNAETANDPQIQVRTET